MISKAQSNAERFASLEVIWNLFVQTDKKFLLVNYKGAPEWTETQEASQWAAFERMIPKRYCYMDMNRTLEDPKLHEFLLSLK